MDNGYDWDPQYDLHDEEMNDEEMDDLGEPVENRWGNEEVRNYLSQAFADSVADRDHDRLLRVTEAIDVSLNEQGIQLGLAEDIIHVNDIVEIMNLNYTDVIDWFLERGYPLHDMIYLAILNDFNNQAYRLLDKVDKSQQHALLNLILARFVRILNNTYYGLEVENNRVLAFLVENGANPNTISEEAIANLHPRYVAFFHQWKNGTLPLLQKRNALVNESGKLLGNELGDVVGQFVVKPMGFRSTRSSQQSIHVPHTIYLKKLHDLGFNVNLNGDEQYTGKIRQLIRDASLLSEWLVG